MRVPGKLAAAVTKQCGWTFPPQRLGQPGRDQFWRWPKQL
jgi:hypothetical protein